MQNKQMYGFRRRISTYIPPELYEKEIKSRIEKNGTTESQTVRALLIKGIEAEKGFKIKK